jgi:hypothetical protein
MAYLNSDPTDERQQAIMQQNAAAYRAAEAAQALEKQKTLQIEPGEVVVCTSGTHDEYRLEYLLVAAKPFNMAEQAREFIAATNRDHLEGFAGFLVGKGLATPLKHREVWLGEDNNFDPDFMVTKEA